MTEKKIKNEDSKHGSEAVGEEVEPVACTKGYEVLLKQLGEAAVGDADGEGEQQSPLFVGRVTAGVLLSIAPDAGEGEDGIHEEMHHLVKAEDRLGVGQ